MWLDAREWAREHLEPNSEHVPTRAAIMVNFRETIGAYMDEVSHSSMTRYSASKAFQCAMREGYTF